MRVATKRLQTMRYCLSTGAGASFLILYRRRMGEQSIFKDEEIIIINLPLSSRVRGECMCRAYGVPSKSE